MVQLQLESPQATEALGAQLARAVSAGHIVYLRGDLGTGKTTLVRGFLRALGYPGTVRSPTYTLVELYTVDDRQIIHLDLYRLTDPEELEYIGLRDFLDGQSILLVEWPERGLGMLPTADINLYLDYADTGRLCRLQAVSVKGHFVLDSLTL